MSQNPYKTIKIIGRGNFGRAQLVENQLDSKLYVIKKLENHSDTAEAIRKQIQIMRNLSHQHIIRYYQSFLDDRDCMCIVMQYAENGELDQYLKQRKSENSYLTEQQVIEWFIQLCLGLKYIHQKNIVHRDLKSQNVFITGQGELKIGDFGISKEMSNTFQMAKTKIGTPCIMAPQIWENKKYNQKSDIWSLGCILYYMMTLNPPFQCSTIAGFVQKITTGSYKPITGHYSKQLKDLVSKMLSLQAHDRPSVQSILKLSCIRKKLSEVLENTLKRYEESSNLLIPALDKNRASLSNQRLSQKRSLSSLSNSSMLTPKNTSTFNSTKIVEMKQSYPILVQQVKQLKKQVQQHNKQKQNFVEETKQLLQKMRRGGGGKGELQQAITDLQHKLTNYLYP